MPHIAFIGLGSNLEDPHRQLHSAFAALDGLPDTRLLARSSMYRSAPLGSPEQPDIASQPDFVNAVAQITTDLAPQALLAALLQIELSQGRLRSFRNAPRTLDMDVLLYSDLQLHEHGLTIPHPQMHRRAFVLQPLLEIAPDIAIPGVGPASLALAQCRDQILDRIPDDI